MACRSLTLKVVDPGREAACGHDHAASVGQIWLTVVLDLQVGNLARVERSGQLGSELEVSIVEVNLELALLVKWIFEVHTNRLGTGSAPDWTLRLWCLRLTKEEA